MAAIMAQPLSLDQADSSFTSENNQVPEMQQWRDLAKMVRDIGPLLQPDAELRDLAAAEAAVIARDMERTEMTDRLKEELQELSHQLALAKQAAQRPENQPTHQEHIAHVHRLEDQQLAISKQLSEVQAAVGKKEVELGRWKVEKEEVGNMDVGDQKSQFDGKVIRLQMYSNVGFTLIPSRNDSAAKVLIRNEAKSDIHAVSLDPSRSKAYNANTIWALASD